uniref:G-protein coupled receptors family 1 profile domain-containing protein n=2 Tax=Anolis carolinensis TaxID=28377 RepID=H9GED4_ANOCA
MLQPWAFSLPPPSGAPGNDSGNVNNSLSCAESADFQFVLFPVVYSLVFVLGLVGNLFVLSYFLRTKSATAPANVFLVNLAVLDLLFVLTLPFRVAYHALRNDWVFGEALCKIIGGFFFANLYGSSLFLALICLERYLAVVHPLLHLRLRSSRLRLGAVLAVWAVLVAAVLFMALRGPLTSTFPNGHIACLENFSTSSWKGRISGISIFAAVVGFLLPLALIIVCYPLIAWRLLAPPTVGSGAGSRTAKRKALRTVLVVLGVFLVCFAPYHLVQLVHTLSRVGLVGGCPLLRGTYAARRVTMALTSLNACLDPLVYYFAAERFSRQSSWRLCGSRCGCCLPKRLPRPLWLQALTTSKTTTSSSTGESTVPGPGQ